MSRKTKSLLLIFVCFLFSSCVEDVNLNTRDEYVMCLNCVLANEEEQTAWLCWSKGNSDLENIPIEDAEICLYLKDGSDSTLVGMFRYVSDGKWTLDYTPTWMHEYSILVKDKEGNILYSHTRTPGKIEKKHLGSFDYSHHIIHDYTNKLLCDEECIVWSYVLSSDGMMSEFVATTHAFADTSIICSYGYTVIKAPYDDSIRVNRYNYLMRFRHTPDYRTSYGMKYSGYMKEGPFNEGNTWEECELSVGDDGMLWGPGIYFGSRIQSGDLYLFSVSEEYDTYLYDNWQFYLKSIENDSFISVFDSRSPYTNIINGKGIFGAIYKINAGKWWFDY